MRPILRIFIAGTAVATLWQPVFAVMVTGQPKPNPYSQAATGVVERGGSIDAIDIAKKSLTVDKQSYVLASTSVTVHSGRGDGLEKLDSLKPGTKIRFKTTKYNQSNQEQVSEIWISIAPKAAVKK